MAKSILLTQGYEALVDDEDFDFLNQWSWLAQTSGHQGKKYAARHSRLEEHGNLPRYYVYMHRVVAERSGILIAKLEVDHKDRDGLNNQRFNIRVADDFLQQQNTGVRSDNTSGVKGVSFEAQLNKWHARIQVRRTRIDLGCFDTYEQAVEARHKAERRFYRGST